MEGNIWNLYLETISHITRKKNMFNHHSLQISLSEEIDIHLNFEQQIQQAHNIKNNLSILQTPAKFSDDSKVQNY